MTAYYNEIDPDAAQWLRNLIKAGHIADGVVDTRSISEVEPYDLREFTQCHFFAGIGVWSFALRLAGWPDDRPVWTGSCPCQPFSSAGRADGFADERHLWPHWHHLIRECRPAVVFGEQVASKAVEPWIDLVQADMEGLGYAFAGIPFPSAGVGAPHIRDRLFWVADAGSKGLEERQVFRGFSSGAAKPVERETIERSGIHATGGMGHPGSSRRQPQPPIIRIDGEGVGSPWGEQVPGIEAGSHAFDEQPPAGPVNGFWADADWLLCRDGKWRPVEPGTFPLVDGAPARVVRLRAYGNAINAEAAREFIEAYLDLEAVGGLV